MAVTKDIDPMALLDYYLTEEKKKKLIQDTKAFLADSTGGTLGIHALAALSDLEKSKRGPMLSGGPLDKFNKYIKGAKDFYAYTPSEPSIYDDYIAPTTGAEFFATGPLANVGAAKNVNKLVHPPNRGPRPHPTNPNLTVETKATTQVANRKNQPPKYEPDRSREVEDLPESLTTDPDVNTESFVDLMASTGKQDDSGIITYPPGESPLPNENLEPPPQMMPEPEPPPTTVVNQDPWWEVTDAELGIDPDVPPVGASRLQTGITQETPEHIRRARETRLGRLRDKIEALERIRDEAPAQLRAGYDARIDALRGRLRRTQDELEGRGGSSAQAAQPSPEVATINSDLAGIENRLNIYQFAEDPQRAVIVASGIREQLSMHLQRIDYLYRRGDITSAEADEAALRITRISRQAEEQINEVHRRTLEADQRRPTIDSSRARGNEGLTPEQQRSLTPTQTRTTGQPRRSIEELINSSEPLSNDEWVTLHDNYETLREQFSRFSDEFDPSNPQEAARYRQDITRLNAMQARLEEGLNEGAGLEQSPNRTPAWHETSQQPEVNFSRHGATADTASGRLVASWPRSVYDSVIEIADQRLSWLRTVAQVAEEGGERGAEALALLETIRREDPQEFAVYSLQRQLLNQMRDPLTTDERDRIRDLLNRLMAEYLVRLRNQSGGD